MYYDVILDTCIRYTGSADLEVGDCIRVERPDSAPWYGVIRWIGTLPGTSTAPLAGMEMVSTYSSLATTTLYSMNIGYSASS